ncbi:pyridoxal phosphate-dependent aminotransferase [Pseudoalteromonas sp. PS1M3]|uniref:pyridoxal phosphate-dependent aminotransferase n=1 Tax=Pseudoalteromonas sp. PS1M3 TaxID=87791 RepID=UPI0019502E6C|nr:pyridoxal phosphate-dependent aminotransferase [Pseudoalteromonas sp. PS1M3]BBW92219.1 pyridoxal phosphate-dependent aminotransferase [Pseudoalteromonas sp. PS1M3]
MNPTVKSIPQALSVYINQLVYELKQRQLDITTLSMGEAYFNIPSIDFNDIDYEAGYHYSDSQGLLSLRKKISDYYYNSHGVKFSSENEILVTAGSKIVIYMVMLAILKKGDEVLTHEPAWLSYQEQVKLVGGESSFIPYDVSVECFESYITNKTRLIIINNPNNPQGKIYNKSEIQLIYRLCLKYKIYLLVDEAYSDFVEGNEFCSAGRAIKELDNLIIVNSLSKNFGMSGWRIGYAITNNELIKELLKLNQHLITCAASPLMMYLDKHFETILNLTRQQAVLVTKKRNRIVRKAESLGFMCLPGSATFYIFIDLNEYNGSVFNLALYLLLECKIAVVPGLAYGKSTEKCIRVSVGTESESDIIKALKKIQIVINNSDLLKIDVDLLLKKHNLPNYY